MLVPVVFPKEVCYRPVGNQKEDYGCASENNRRARLTREGREPLQVGNHDWEQTAVIIAGFFKAKAEDWT